MPKYETKDIRNVILVGHNSSGKTTLADAMLYKGKATSRFGSIDEGTSVFDFEPEEKDRKVSIDLAVASVSHAGREINILDAPGYADFSGEAVGGMNAVETAVLCVNAAGGIMVNTRKMWDLAAKLGVARLIAINKMDSENVHFLRLVNTLREVFGKICVPVTLPLGAGDDFRGVADVLQKPGDVPAEFKEMANEAREKIMECDDALLE